MSMISVQNHNPQTTKYYTSGTCSIVSMDSPEFLVATTSLKIGVFGLCVFMYSSWCLGALLTGQEKNEHIYESTATSVTPTHSSTGPAYGSSVSAEKEPNSKEKVDVSISAIAQLLMQV